MDSDGAAPCPDTLAIEPGRLLQRSRGGKRSGMSRLASPKQQRTECGLSLVHVAQAVWMQPVRSPGRVLGVAVAGETVAATAFEGVRGRQRIRAAGLDERDRFVALHALNPTEVRSDPDSGIQGSVTTTKHFID